MDHLSFKSTGVALILGALLIIFTMILHPTGGSLEYIIQISKVITVVHAMAIFSLPIVAFGFYGLSMRLKDQFHLSILAFITVLFGLIAAMFAALFNGLSLPYFLNQYSDRLEENIDLLKPIASFSFAVNKSLDYIFIVACCLAILIYSVIILLEKKFPVWLGYLGISIILFSVIGGLTDFVFTNLFGFRVFTFSLAFWILSCGAYLFRTKGQ